MEGEELFAIAAKVAPRIVGGRWRFNRIFSEQEGKDHQGIPYAAVLTNDQNQNERLYMRTDWHAKDRIAINGMWPDNYKRSTWTHFQSVRITVATNRAAGGIASDIVRRLLPEYRKRLADVTKNHTARREAAEHLAQCLHLIGLHCTQPLEEWQKWANLEKWQFQTALTGGVIERMYDHTWHVSMRLSFDDAVRLLAWLNRDAPTAATSADTAPSP